MNERLVGTNDFLRNFYYSLRGNSISFNRSWDPEDDRLWLVNPTTVIAYILGISRQQFSEEEREVVSGLMLQEFHEQKTVRMTFGDWRGEMQFNWETGELDWLTKRVDKRDGQFWGLYDDHELVLNFDVGEGRVFTFTCFPGGDRHLSSYWGEGSAQLYYHWNLANQSLTFVSYQACHVKRSNELRIPQVKGDRISFEIKPLGKFTAPARLPVVNLIRSTLLPQRKPVLNIGEDGIVREDKFRYTYDFLGIKWEGN